MTTDLISKVIRFAALRQAFADLPDGDNGSYIEARDILAEGDKLLAEIKADVAALAQPELAPTPAAQVQPDDTNKLSEDCYCLGCRKLGHRTDECHSTHGLNTPEAREIGRLAHIAWNARQATPPVALPAVVDAEASIEGGKWDGAEYWMPLAWALCAEENGEDACNELVWEGGPIPEPWGDRWLKYEDEAKRLIALVREHTTHPAPAASASTASRVEEGRSLKRLIGEYADALEDERYEAIDAARAAGGEEQK